MKTSFGYMGVPPNVGAILEILCMCSSIGLVNGRAARLRYKQVLVSKPTKRHECFAHVYTTCDYSFRSRLVYDDD